MATNTDVIANRIAWKFSMWLSKRNTGSYRRIVNPWPRQATRFLQWHDYHGEIYQSLIELIDREFDNQVRNQWLPAVGSGRWNPKTFNNAYDAAEKDWKTIYLYLREHLEDVGITIPPYPTENIEWVSRLHAVTYHLTGKRSTHYLVRYDVKAEGFPDAAKAVELLTKTLKDTNPLQKVRLDTGFGDSYQVLDCALIPDEDDYIHLTIMAEHPTAIFGHFDVNIKEAAWTVNKAERKWLSLQVFNEVNHSTPLIGEE